MDLYTQIVVLIARYQATLGTAPPCLAFGVYAYEALCRQVGYEVIYILGIPCKIYDVIPTDSIYAVSEIQLQEIEKSLFSEKVS